jgi:hypothetical protein
MGPESLDTLDAVLAGLHTLAGHAGSVEDEQLRHKLTSTIVGLRSAILTARGQVLHMQEQLEQLTAQARQFSGEPASATRHRAPRMKWGCYQFDDSEGLFCTACFDKRNRRVRTMRHNSANLVCPNCRTLFPVR